MKSFLLAAAILFSLFLALPLVQKATRLPLDYPLAGVEPTAARPAVGFSAWWRGTLQSSFDAWLNQHVGCRGLLVRTANQIHFTLYGELPLHGGTQVLMGRDGMLFEKPYVDAYNSGGKKHRESFPHVSASTRRLQDRLARDGIAFLLVIAPSKAEIYPEFLPAEADVAGRPSRRSNYQHFIEFLRRDGVNLVDAHELFLRWKAEPGTPRLFADGGTHWNDYAAARVVEEILRRLRELTGKDLPAVKIAGASTNRTIVGEDNDLGELVNLWSGRLLAGLQVHPVVEAQAGTYLPDLLFVGDSFGTTLTEFMDRHKLYRRRDTFHYYGRRFSYPEDTDFVLDKAQLDLLAELRGRDAVVIEVAEYWLPRIGFGFVRDALNAYDAWDAAQGAAAPR
ncbi:MAG: hypothetical protein AB7V14_06340 [Kiritimatiellia bacterium]